METLEKIIDFLNDHKQQVIVFAVAFIFGLLLGAM